MYEIMQHCQSYVPKIAQETVTNAIPYFRLLSGGDALTCARQRGLQKIMENSDNQLMKCDGLVPIIEDWHTKVVLLEVIITTCVHTCTCAVDTVKPSLTDTLYNGKPPYKGHY